MSQNNNRKITKSSMLYALSENPFDEIKHNLLLENQPSNFEKREMRNKEVAKPVRLRIPPTNNVRISAVRPLPKVAPLVMQVSSAEATKVLKESTSREVIQSAETIYNCHPIMHTVSQAFRTFVESATVDEMHVLCVGHGSSIREDRCHWSRSQQQDSKNFHCLDGIYCQCFTFTSAFIMFEINNPREILDLFNRQKFLRRVYVACQNFTGISGTRHNGECEYEYYIKDNVERVRYSIRGHNSVDIESNRWMLENSTIDLSSCDGEHKALSWKVVATASDSILFCFSTTTNIKGVIYKGVNPTFITREYGTLYGYDVGNSDFNTPFPYLSSGKYINRDVIDHLLLHCVGMEFTSVNISNLITVLHRHLISKSKEIKYMLHGCEMEHVTIALNLAHYKQLKYNEYLLDNPDAVSLSNKNNKIFFGNSVHLSHILYTCAIYASLYIPKTLQELIGFCYNNCGVHYHEVKTLVPYSNNSVVTNIANTVIKYVNIDYFKTLTLNFKAFEMLFNISKSYKYDIMSKSFVAASSYITTRLFGKYCLGHTYFFNAPTVYDWIDVIGVGVFGFKYTLLSPVIKILLTKFKINTVSTHRPHQWLYGIFKRVEGATSYFIPQMPYLKQIDRSTGVDVRVRNEPAVEHIKPSAAKLVSAPLIKRLPTYPSTDMHGLLVTVFEKSLKLKVEPKISAIECFVCFFQNNWAVLLNAQISPLYIPYLDFYDVVAKYPTSKREKFTKAFNVLIPNAPTRKDMLATLFVKFEGLLKDKLATEIPGRPINDLSTFANVVFLCTAVGITALLNERLNFSFPITLGIGYNNVDLAKWFLLDKIYIETDGSAFDASQNDIIIRGVHHKLLEICGASKEVLNLHKLFFNRKIMTKDGNIYYEKTGGNMSGSQFTIIFNSVTKALLDIFVYCISNNRKPIDYFPKQEFDIIPDLTYHQLRHYVTNQPAAKSFEFSTLVVGDDSVCQTEKNINFNTILSDDIGIKLTGHMSDDIFDISFCSAIIVPVLINGRLGRVLTPMCGRIICRLPYVVAGKIRVRDEPAYCKGKLIGMKAITKAFSFMQKLFDLLLSYYDTVDEIPHVYNQYNPSEMASDYELLSCDAGDLYFMNRYKTNVEECDRSLIFAEKQIKLYPDICEDLDPLFERMYETDVFDYNKSLSLSDNYQDFI